MADATDSKSVEVNLHVGSTPTTCTSINKGITTLFHKLQNLKTYKMTKLLTKLFLGALPLLKLKTKKDYQKGIES